MPSRARTEQEKLERVILEHEKDASLSRHRSFHESIRPRQPDPLSEYLTDREQLVILAKTQLGWSRKKIARGLLISPLTVTSLRKEALKKLPSEIRAKISKHHYHAQETELESEDAMQ